MQKKEEALKRTINKDLEREIEEANPANYRMLLGKIAKEEGPVKREVLLKRLARRLGVKTAVLRQELALLLPPSEPQGTLVIEEVDPWPEPVDGRAVLGEIEAIVERHVKLTLEQRAAVTLWIALTYCFDAFHVLPLLAITSPERRCGKTTLLSLLSRLVNRPLPAANITPAAVFRVIEELQPTLLIDEGDSFLKESDELRGILNSGHSRDTAFVVRVNLQTYQLERFSTWAPKALALIGNLPPTLVDRAILLRLVRKLPQEKTERLPLETPESWLTLRRKLRRWAEDHFHSLKEASVEIPLQNDRAKDNWGVLAAIAQEVGGDWLDRVRSAALALEGDDKGEESLGIQLLLDLREIFNGEPALFTSELLERLLLLEDRPWAELRNGRPLNAHGLSRLLRPFGVQPVNLRRDGVVRKGYRLGDLQPIWQRYLPPPKQCATPLQPNIHVDLRDLQTATKGQDVADWDVQKTALSRHCSDVAVREGGGDKGILPNGNPLEVDDGGGRGSQAL